MLGGEDLKQLLPGKPSASHSVMELTDFLGPEVCTNQPLLTSWHQKQQAGLAGSCLLPRGHT